MAKVELNPSLMHISGRIGNLVYRRNGNGTSISTRPAPTSAPPSAAQLGVREQFAAAAAYATVSLADPVLGPRYTAAAVARGMRPRAFAVADFFSPPVVKALDLSGYHGLVGDAIAVLAVDDFEVAGVTVVLRSADQTVLEQGAAVLSEGRWRYLATTAIAVGQAITVEAVAKDRPGHTGTRSEPLVVA